MKIILLFFLLISQLGVTQNSRLNYVEDSSLARILNSVSYYKVYPTTQLAISIIIVCNESESANIPESDEVSHKVFVGVCEYDEYPKRMLYSSDEIYAPRDYKVTEKGPNNILLTFTYGPKLKPKFIELKITNEGVAKLKL